MPAYRNLIGMLRWGLLVVVVGCSSSGRDLFGRTAVGAGGADAGHDAATGTGGGGGCARDLDCKGARVCERGACIDVAGAGGVGATGTGGVGNGGAPAGGTVGAGGERIIDSGPEVDAHVVAAVDAGTCITWSCNAGSSLRTRRQCAAGEPIGTETGQGCSTDAGSYRCGSEATACAIAFVPATPDPAMPCDAPSALMYAARGCVPNDCPCNAPGGEVCLGSDAASWCASWKPMVEPCVNWATLHTILGYMGMAEQYRKYCGAYP